MTNQNVLGKTTIKQISAPPEKKWKRGKEKGNAPSSGSKKKRFLRKSGVCDQSLALRGEGVGEEDEMEKRM